MKMAKRPNMGKKDTKMLPMGKAGPNMMPHKGGKDCRCPSCKEKRK